MRQMVCKRCIDCCNNVLVLIPLPTYPNLIYVLGSRVKVFRLAKFVQHMRETRFAVAYYFSCMPTKLKIDHRSLFKIQMHQCRFIFVHHYMLIRIHIEEFLDVRGRHIQHQRLILKFCRVDHSLQTLYRYTEKVSKIRFMSIMKEVIFFIGSEQLISNPLIFPL